MGARDLYKQASERARIALKKVKLDTKPLDHPAARAAAAAQVAELAGVWERLGFELGALQGGAVKDLLDEFGLDSRENRTIGQLPGPTEGMQNPGETDGFNTGLPRNQRHRSTAGLGVPSFKDIYAGLPGYGGGRSTATPVPGQSSTIVEPGGKWYTSLLTDGTRVSGGEGWRGGAYHMFTTTERADGATKTTTVIVTSDGRTATFTDVYGGSQNPNTTATGDPAVIAQEQDRRASGEGDDFDDVPPRQPQPQPEEEPESEGSPQPQPIPPSEPYPRDDTGGPITINVDPDSPYNGGNVWGYYNPFTGQYWGPERKLNANQVNPGRGETGTPVGGSQLRMDPKDLVINPNPDALRASPQLRLRTPRDGHIGPTPRPPEPD